MRAALLSAARALSDLAAQMPGDFFGERAPIAARGLPGAAEGSRIDRGQTITVQPGTSGVDVVHAIFATEQACTLTFQGDNTGATLSVMLVVGEARFTRSFFVTAAAQSVTLTARAIYVSASVPSTPQGGGSATHYGGTTGVQPAVKVSASLTPGDSNPLGATQGVWITLLSPGAPPVVNANTAFSGGNVAAGALLAVQGSLSNMGGAAALYLFVFDPSILYVNGVVVTNAGSGYTSAPSATLAGSAGNGSTNPTLGAVSMAVDAVQITAGGTGYTSAPTVTFGAPTLPGGVQATGTATFAAGAVTGVTITNPGSGYTSSPSVGFSGGGGSGATATCTLHIASIAVATVGAGVTLAQTVTISGGGGANGAASTTISLGTAVPLIPPAMLLGTGSFGVDAETRVSAQYTTGLSWVLSTTQAQCSTPAAGALARVDFLVGL